MKKKYFDNWKFEQALSCINDNPLKAKLMYKEYIEKYPKDYCAYSFLASALITLGEFDEAGKVLLVVKKLIDKDKHFNSDYTKMMLFENSFYFNKVRLLSYQENYNELYKLCINQLKNLEYIEDISFYCQSKLGKLNTENRVANSYLFRQIIKYDEKDFLYHMKKHLTDCNFSTDLPNQSIFTSKFPLEEVIKEIKKYMPSQKCLYSGFFDNIYIFKFDNCGKDNNKVTNYFKVVCFHNTNDIITMYPSNDCKNLPYIDLNYIVPEDMEFKVKKLNQIDKFNQKYKRN